MIIRMTSGFDPLEERAPETQPPLTAETVAAEAVAATNSSIMADEHVPSQLVITADKPPPAVMQVAPHSPQHTVNDAHYSPLSSAPQRCHCVSFCCFCRFCQSCIQCASRENNDTADGQLRLWSMVVHEDESQRGHEGTTALVFSK